MAVQLSKLLREIRVYEQMAAQLHGMDSPLANALGDQAMVAGRATHKLIKELSSKACVIAGGDASIAVVKCDDILYQYSIDQNRWQPMILVDADNVLIGGDDA